MISIIIPVYNEEDNIQNFINSLLPLIESSIKLELLFVDGGSSDLTVEICKKNQLNVIVSPQKGRAYQMNYGAKNARGNILYFLHSDSIPPKNFASIITTNVENGIEAGCFRLAFYPANFVLDLYAWFSKFNIDLFRFGDQSLFVTKHIFEKIGGFNTKLLVMEDQQIVRDIKKIGSFKICHSKVKTSSRKYYKIGIIKLQFIFTIIVLMYYTGFSQNSIVSFYTKRLKSSIKKR